MWFFFLIQPFMLFEIQQDNTEICASTRENCEGKSILYENIKVAKAEFIVIILSEVSLESSGNFCRIDFS